MRRCDAPTQRRLHRGTSPLLSLPAPFSLLAHSLFYLTLVLPRMFSPASHLSFPEVQRQVKPLCGSRQTDLFPAVATGTTCTKPLPRSTNGQMKGEQTPGASSFLRGHLGSSSGRLLGAGICGGLGGMHGGGAQLTFYPRNISASQRQLAG